MSTIKDVEVQAWVAEEFRSGTSRAVLQQALALFRLLLGYAVKTGRTMTNAASGVKLPPKQPSDRCFLNVQQVKALAQAAGEHYSLFIQVLSTTGIRFGEATALRVSDVDLNGSRIRIQRAFTSVGGRLIEKSPKSHASRTVLFPAFLRDDLGHSMRHKDPTDLVFTTAEGYPIRNENFRRRVFLGAVKEAGEILGTPLPPVTVHDLRHTAASLAISSGANIKVIQRMLGHASADMTLDVYGHLYESDLDSVAQRMNQQFKSA